MNVHLDPFVLLRQENMLGRVGRSVVQHKEGLLGAALFGKKFSNSWGKVIVDPVREQLDIHPSLLVRLPDNWQLLHDGLRLLALRILLGKRPGILGVVDQQRLQGTSAGRVCAEQQRQPIFHYLPPWHVLHAFRDVGRVRQLLPEQPGLVSVEDLIPMIFVLVDDSTELDLVLLCLFRRSTASFSQH